MSTTKAASPGSLHRMVRRLSRHEIEDAINLEAPECPFTMPFFLACLLVKECRRQKLRKFTDCSLDHDLILTIKERKRMVRRRYPTHRNCTYILPGRAYPEGREKWLREKTHGCWCSAWKLLDGGQWRIWRLGRWCKPKPGELRSTEREPPNIVLADTTSLAIHATAPPAPAQAKA